MPFRINSKAGLECVEGVVSDVLALSSEKNTYLRLSGSDNGYVIANGTRIVDCGERVRLYHNNEKMPASSNLKVEALEVLGESERPKFVWAEEYYRDNDLLVLRD